MTLSENSPRAMSGHLVANQILMAVMAMFSLLSLASVVLNLLLLFAGDSPGSPLAGLSTAPADPAERLGFFGTFGVIGFAALASLVWAPLNVWGLVKRAEWARRSSILYWIASLATCLCIPVGIYGIVSLTRSGVRVLFESS